MDFEDLSNLKKYCQSYNININDKNLKYFDIYKKFLKEYNKKINLTAIVEDEAIIKKHFLDSLILDKYLDFKNKKLIDIGTGAGFPGVPLKIINNNLDLTLVDSVAKKTNFLELLKNKLNLDYLVINQRAEILGKDKKYRETYDIAVARAVKNLKELSEYCLPLVKLDGFLLAMKGPKNIEEEIKEAENIINILGGKIINIFKYKLLSEDDRVIVLIKKISQTPPKYPRSTSQIIKK
ncbi:MAG: 16S rRNA (guanine(527)-N(7))-methyltransferase RsmG [Oscillospiraceae bacterium]|nr:16S rRNA (guanine(527)-N(7))-methyltransferase RsmG [Oscillospiraceae bacterium]